MNSDLYFNPIWAKTRQGLNIALWASSSPDSFSMSARAHSYSESPSEDKLLLQKENKPLLFVGGVHGDEPEGVWLAEAFLNHILTQKKRAARSSQKEGTRYKQPWVLIPCLNVEGFHRRQRTNSAGVDLNRNFPSPDWSSEARAERYYPGPHPASEPETQALIKAIETFDPALIIHFHSWNPCVVYTGEGALPVASVLSKDSGYPCHEDIGYPTPGSLGQYGWLSHQTPVICIEEQDGTPREYVWRRFKNSLAGLIL